MLVTVSIDSGTLRISLDEKYIGKYIYFRIRMNKPIEERFIAEVCRIPKHSYFTHFKRVNINGDIFTKDTYLIESFREGLKLQDNKLPKSAYFKII